MTTQTHDWKPGDVGMVKCSDGTWRRAWCKASSTNGMGGLVFVFADGAHRDVDYSYSRRIVVIDPEDSGQTADLTRAVAVASDQMDLPLGRAQDNLAKALRSMVGPTKPDEPTGLGAVVEDQRGELWIRDKTTTTVNHWKLARGEDGGSRYPWSHISATSVISEGVPA